MSVLDLNYNYASLSLHDLLDARDTYHFHLLSKANVIGTAVGRYLIRSDEGWPSKKGEGRSPKKAHKNPRTLSNSEVRDYSWPCILAFVRTWETEEAFGVGAAYNPAQILPKTLFMPDGRAVPVCVVEAGEVVDPPPDHAGGTVVRPAHMLGGGLPIMVDVQGARHRATVGCLVSDGHLTYALTARHVCGEAGTPVMSELRAGAAIVGTSSAKQMTRLPFSEVYPEFAGRRSFVSLDVGLIRVDDVEEWTSNTYGLPPVGPMADVHERNLSLRLVDQPVVGFGAVSGLVTGKIKALFYRHRSVGGYDYVGDFVIAPAAGSATRPGDSGMVWHLDVTDEEPNIKKQKPLPSRDLRPLAIEWGGQVFSDAGNRSQFAVATSLSNVCRLLDVELITDQSRGVAGYWGRTGHYSIAALAIRLVGDPRLRDFLNTNADLLSFDLETIAKKGFDKVVATLSAEGQFVPLADVPDEIWKKLPFGKQGREGGRDGGGGHGSDGPEHPNHYADIDAIVGEGGKTWRALCLADDNNLSVAAWQGFYEAMAQKSEANGDHESAGRFRNPLKQGLLPFRIWQFFDAMKGFVQTQDVVGYLTAAGIVAHYVGDASQPLHGSIFADGDPARTATRQHVRLGTTETVRYGEGVHSAYESAMVSAYAPDLLQRIEDSLDQNHGLPLRQTGKAIARAAIELMEEVAGILPPLDIIDIYEQAGAGTRKATLDALWEHTGDATAKVMAEGARSLAMLWESAWVVGNGAAIPDAALVRVDSQSVRRLYIDASFVPSRVLDDIGEVLV